MASASYEVFEGVVVARSRQLPALKPWKIALDAAGSLAALIILAPLLIAISFLIWALNRGPIFYAHERIGRGGRTFRCLKFRTMKADAEGALESLLTTDPVARAEWLHRHKIKNDPRVTRFGRFLRRTSMDELPQLINVLKGDMSLVGPRPIVVSEAAKYGRYFVVYSGVKPGLTGLWQVSGRNNTSYRRRVAFDVVYSRRTCLRLDIWILLSTVPVVLRADGY